MLFSNLLTGGMSPLHQKVNEQNHSSLKSMSLPFTRAYDWSSSLTSLFCLCINTASLHLCRITPHFSICSAEAKHCNTKTLLMSFLCLVGCFFSSNACFQEFAHFLSFTKCPQVHDKHTEI